MKLLRHLPIIATAAAGLLLAGCVHTPPGTSVKVALAKKAELIRMPEPPASAVASATATARAVEPELPSNNKVEQVADAFTRGQFCMKAGKEVEAIEAFEETVQLDPQFSDAWQCLAILYEKSGQEEKALEAFRRSKKLARG